MEIKVLALNDTNHDTTFYLEDNFVGYDMRSFIKTLALCHEVNYKIRYVYLLDIPDDDIKAQEAFDVVDCRVMHMPWNEAFDFLYDFYGKDW